MTRDIDIAGTTFVPLMTAAALAEAIHFLDVMEERHHEGPTEGHRAHLSMLLSTLLEAAAEQTEG